MNMGREHPTMVIPPGVHKRTERARRARDTVNKVIPDILRASPRARHGIHKSALVVDPAPPTQHGETPLSSLPDAGPAIRLLCTDTLDAAARMSERPFAPRRPTSTSTSTEPQPPRPNIAILSFASPLKPGGGFLDGANSQEDFLCARSTLYPSLWPAFYRLPDLGGVHTPDVLVFRDSTPQAHERPKRDRFLVDVVSAAMLRFPAAPTTSTTRGGRPVDEAAGACSCGVSYCDGHRDLVARKMRAVLRIAQAKGAERVVLGAWGCGASGNPVAEVARLWRKVLVGSLRQRRPNAERWQGIREVVFAIPDRGMAKEFEVAFKDILAHDAPFSPTSAQDPVDAEPASFVVREEPTEIADLVAQIQATEMRLDLAPHARARQRLRDVLAGLNRDLNRSLAARRLAEEEEEEELEDALPHASEDGDDNDDDDDGFVAIAASDGEEGAAGNSVYHFDEDDVASDSSDATAPEAFEFRPLPGLDFGASHDDAYDGGEFGGDGGGEEDGAGQTYDLQLLQPSPNFDAKTGWFSGSIDELQGLMRAGAVSRGGSHASPELRGQRRGMAGEGEGEGDVEELSLDRGFGQSRGGGA
ncbi:hypothetical protein LTR53_017404 [Teratosphaeriaceae sp. CCFEE 6253]|nr:hypothetical protein LTR53_017404 [Teratosphaeriaceae sp. CCFEE 6253]